MILSLDIGGSFIKYCLMTEKYELTEKGSIPTEKYNFSNLITQLRDIHDQYSFVEGIAISVPGSVDDNGKSTGISAIEYIYNQNIKKEMEAISSKRVSIENDANSALLSEFIENDVKNTSSIVIGTGIGGSFTSNGKIVKGYNFSAGEFGCVVSRTENGLLEVTGLSIVQLVNKYQKYFDKKIDGKIIFEMFHEGNEVAKEAIKEFFERLATLVINIEHITNPDTIVFSGAVTQQDSFIWLYEEYANHLFNENKDIYRQPAKTIKVSKYGGDANLFGAAYKWFREGKDENN